MDAQLKKIQVTPAKRDKDGDIVKEEFATITVEVPLDSAGQNEALIAIMQLLSREWVQVHIEGKKPAMS